MIRSRSLPIASIRSAAALLFLLAGAGAAAAQGGRPASPHVQASLVAEPAAIQPGRVFTLAIRMVMDPNWHVYWRNPGDSGLPPEIAWDLTPGFSAGAIAWPAPERIPVQHLMNYGYRDEAVLLVPVQAPADLKSGGSVGIGGKLSYLVCEEICVPGSAEIGLDLAVAESGTTSPDPAVADLFARARAALPLPSPWPTRLTRADGRLVLHLDRAGLAPGAIGNVAFFPYAETAIENAAEQVVRSDAAGLHLALTPSDGQAEAPAELPGVLRFDETTPEGVVHRALAIGAAPAEAAPSSAPSGPAAPRPASADEDALTLWSALALAFGGGLLLNLMPCVFPVLSIKVLGLVKQSGAAPGQVRRHGLAYTVGVLASFLALAGALLALKAGGAGIGWGFQLQSPAFVAGLACLMFAVALGLSGVVHVGGGIAGLGDGLTRRAGLQGSFFTGVLTTIVATPCTAPFMGAAVGFALTQPPAVSLAVFASLGLGLALPFLLLTIWPGAVARLPRPGAWMDTLKGVLAFPVYATVAWLIWVLAQQVGPNGLLAVLLGLVLIGFAAWSWERAAVSGGFGRVTGRACALLAVLGAVGLVALAQADPAGERPVASGAGIEPFAQARLDGLRAEGRNVFVDMTAAWCITCQVNERGVLATEAVRDALARRNVVTLRGDWTNQNPEITRLLERHGRSGVPLYLLYPGRAEPAILPQILTTGGVLDALERLPATPAARAAGRAAP